MKTSIVHVLALLGLSTLAANGQGTAFTYQGRLNNGANPANGQYELQFTLFDAVTNGNQIGLPAGVSPVPVSNGLFTVYLDFGAAAFAGAPRWLEIKVNPYGSDAVPMRLAPRQPVTAAPYALFAANAGGLMSFGGAPLDISINGIRAFRIASAPSGSAQLIGGRDNNMSPNAQDAVISGGSGNLNQSAFAVIGGGTGNLNQSAYAVIGGGGFNIIESALFAVIGGGDGNVIHSGNEASVIAGGEGNQIYDFSADATISGGADNSVQAEYSTVAGGGGNIIQLAATYSTISGGSANTIQTNATFSTIGGGERNIIDSFTDYGTISGGSLNEIRSNAPSATVSGGRLNKIFANAANATIGGGVGNTVSPYGETATIAGGENNWVQGVSSTIGGGSGNTASGARSTIAGGVGNQIRINSLFSTIGGGNANEVGQDSSYATIPGGNLNRAAASYTFAAGNRAKANHIGSFVWADATDADFSSTSANQFAVRATGGVWFETTGAGITVDGQPVLTGTNVSRLGPSIESSEITDGTIIDADISPAAAIADTKLAAISTGGKVANSATTATSANSPNAIVTRNASGDFSAGTITANGFSGDGSGLTTLNANSLASGTIPDSRLASNIARTNQVWLLGSSSPGAQSLGTADSSPLELKVNNIRALRLEPTRSNDTVNVLGGSPRNFVGSGVIGATIAGGGSGDYFASNSVRADFGTIAGGVGNTIQIGATNSTIAGGSNNQIETNSVYSVIGGGDFNKIAADSRECTIPGGAANIIGTNSPYSLIGGGLGNSIAPNSQESAIAGGYQNRIGSNSPNSTVGGGVVNIIGPNSSSATIPGGEGNFATNQAFAAGTRAKANHTGAFVWGDSTAADVVSTNANSVTMRAAGGYRLFSNSGATLGVFLAANSGGWTAISDRNAKENFEPVDTRDLLEKVACLPMTTWNYKAQTNGTRHIGVMAQDFKAAFAVGETETGINTVDADGVALAAIQGLNQKVEEQAKELRAKDAELQSLKQRLSKLEELLFKGAPNSN